MICECDIFQTCSVCLAFFEKPHTAVELPTEKTLLLSDLTEGEILQHLRSKKFYHVDRIAHHSLKLSLLGTGAFHFHEGHEFGGYIRMKLVPTDTSLEDSEIAKLRDRITALEGTIDSLQSKLDDSELSAED